VELSHIDCDNCASMAQELAVARDLLRKTWYLPAEGSTVPVYRSRLTADDYEAIVQYLTLIGADRYVPKKEKKP
jgi:hypothetical protein